MKQIKIVLISILIMLGGLVPLTPALALASPLSVAGDSLKQDACAGLDQVSAAQGCDTGGSGINDFVASVVNILSLIVGMAAVIMIIVAGLKFVTANGDSSRVASARNTLIYALIGIAIAALAQVLVHFVLSATNTQK
jgi:hypothetical protein